MTERRFKIQAITYLMIGIMGFIITNKAVFLHMHKMANGSVIVHAHPFNKSSDSNPYKTHHHTKAGYLFFQNAGLVLLTLLFTYKIFRSSVNTEHLTVLIPDYPTLCYVSNKGRAPPVL